MMAGSRVMRVNCFMPTSLANSLPHLMRSRQSFLAPGANSEDAKTTDLLV